MSAGCRELRRLQSRLVIFAWPDAPNLSYPLCRKLQNVRIEGAFYKRRSQGNWTQLPVGTLPCALRGGVLPRPFFMATMPNVKIVTCKIYKHFQYVWSGALDGRRLRLVVSCTGLLLTDGSKRDVAWSLVQYNVHSSQAAFPKRIPQWQTKKGTERTLPTQQAHEQERTRKRVRYCSPVAP